MVDTCKSKSPFRATDTVCRGRITAWRLSDIWPPLAEIAAALELISAQALLAQVARKPVTLVVDEFHTLPGADYEQVLGELTKYSANMLLATQTLSRLDRLTDSQRTRNLRASVFQTSTACSLSTSAPRTPLTLPRNSAVGSMRRTCWSWGTTSATHA